MELTGVHHVSITVTDLEPAVAFYTDLLGLRVLPRPDFGVAGVWLELADQRQVHLIVDAAHVAANGPHFAVAVDDIDAGVAELQASGVEVSRISNLPSGARQCFFHDPDGNRIELHQRAPVAVA